jgi:signal transduction histidine kinase
MRAVLTVAQGGLAAASPAARRSVMESLLNDFPAFAEVVLYDDAFREVQSLGRLPRNAGRPFLDARAAGADVGSRGYHFGPVEEGPYPSMVVCVPAPSGYLAARANLLGLSDKLDGLDLGAGGRAFLLDGRGRTVARSGPDAAGAARRPDAPKSSLSARAAVPGTDWTVVVKQPTSQVFAALRGARRRMAVGLLSAAALAAALSFLTARRFVRPLREFEAAAKSMREGRFDAVVSARSGDEIGALAKELREAQRALEQRVRQATVGLMAQRLGHDLRQPFAAIRHSLDVVRWGAAGLDETGRRHLDLIEEELERGSDYVEEILTLGRERPSAVLRADLNGIVRRVAERLRLPEGIGLELALADRLPVCLLNEAQVRRALVNLIDNARDALGAGGTVRVATVAEPGRALVRVSDDGRGIPPSDRERVFDEFFTTKSHGTGLGMGIVRKVMELHKGGLRLASREGEGTTVELSFPAA